MSNCEVNNKDNITILSCSTQEREILLKFNLINNNCELKQQDIVNCIFVINKNFTTTTAEITGKVYVTLSEKQQIQTAIKKTLRNTTRAIVGLSKLQYIIIQDSYPNKEISDYERRRELEQSSSVDISV